MCPGTTTEAKLDGSEEFLSFFLSLDSATPLARITCRLITPYSHGTKFKKKKNGRR